VNLYALLEKGFPKNREDCALETPEGLFYTWRDIDRATAMMANLLKSLNLPSGSRVAVQVKNPQKHYFFILQHYELASSICLSIPLIKNLRFSTL